MNATDEKIFCVVCWYKKRREKGLEPLFALFCRPIDFKKTNFTILIILRNTSIFSNAHTHIYNISLKRVFALRALLSSRFSSGSGGSRARSEKKATTIQTRLQKSLKRGVAASFFFPMTSCKMSSLIRVFSPSTTTTTGTTGTRAPLSPRLNSFFAGRRRSLAFSSSSSSSSRAFSSAGVTNNGAAATRPSRRRHQRERRRKLL